MTTENNNTSIFNNLCIDYESKDIEMYAEKGEILTISKSQDEENQTYLILGYENENGATEIKIHERIFYMLIVNYDLLDKKHLLEILKK